MIKVSDVGSIKPTAGCSKIVCCRGGIVGLCPFEKRSYG